MNYKEQYKYYKKKYVNLKYGGSSVDTYENDMIYDLNFLIDNNEVIPDVFEVERQLMEVDSNLQIAVENKESQSVLNKYIKEMGALQVLLDFSRDFQNSSGATFDKNGYQSFYSYHQFGNWQVSGSGSQGECYQLENYISQVNYHYK